MSKNICISKKVSINQLNDGNLLVSDSVKTIVLDQPQLRDIVLHLINESIDSMLLIDSLSKKYFPIEIMRSINILKRYDVIVSSGEGIEYQLHDDILNITSNSTKDIYFSYMGDEILVEKFNEINSSAGEAGIWVLLTKNFLDRDLESIQAQLFSEGKSFIVVKACGEELLISPVLTPAIGLCWHCVTYRMKLNQPMHAIKTSSLELHRAEENFYSKAIPAINRELEGVVLNSGNANNTEGHIVKLDLISGVKSYHPVQHRPQCPCCGDPGLKIDYLALQLFSLDSKIRGDSGGYRTVSAEQTYRDFQYLIDPLTGVMSSVDEYRKVQGAPIFNYSSGRNIALQSRSMFWLNNHLRSSSGGKGKSEQQAKTGALCESIERYSMAFHGQRPCVISSFIELGAQAIEVNECMNFSQNQIADRESINTQCTAFHSLVPIAFDKTKEVDWTSIYSLIDEQLYYLPSEFCYAQYPSDDETRLIAYPDSNGCASGNNYAEAILQGSFELIERDAVAIWWYNRILRDEVDLNLLNNSYVETVRKYYISINRALYVLDITTDMDVPCFVAVSYNKITNKEILYGFGCHLNAAIAVERAVIELNQLLPIVLTKRPEKLDSNMADWLDYNDIKSHAYLRPKSNEKISIEKTYKPTNTSNINLAVEELTSCFKKAKINLLMLDLTQPDIGMPVVKMIAPSLRHFWRRLGPGRLFDVPVKMGWRELPMKEEEVNPFSIVI